MLGQLNKTNLARNIANSTAVVVPSEWHENFPFAVTESLLLGTPVIGSSMGGIPELISDGNNGYVFRTGNEEDLSKKLQILISNGVNWSKEEIVTNIRNRFDCNKHYLEILNLI